MYISLRDPVAPSCRRRDRDLCRLMRTRQSRERSDEFLGHQKQARGWTVAQKNQFRQGPGRNSKHSPKHHTHQQGQRGTIDASRDRDGHRLQPQVERMYQRDSSGGQLPGLGHIHAAGERQVQKRLAEIHRRRGGKSSKGEVDWGRINGSIAHRVAYCDVHRNTDLHSDDNCDRHRRPI